jgi:hypothetical protein
LTLEIADGGMNRTFPEERVPANEAAALKVIVETIEGRVRMAAKACQAHRDAHPKAHGCVKADFRVVDNIPPAFRAGVFAEPRTYKAWIRFSNGSETPQSDSIGDGRGMAIKLMGVAQSPSTTQDFVMVNNPAFFVRNASDYVVFQTASSPLRFFFPSLNPFRFRLHELFVARAITKRVVLNPLNSRYWSMTPYRLGEIAIKYSARPAGALSKYIRTDSPNFLHDNLARQLAEAGASFDFMVQPRSLPQSMPIEDPTVTWDEAAAPFVPIAAITIPPQKFDSLEQHEFCEKLSFTPYHCVDAHYPLGGINRVRSVVYEHVSRLRHELNAVPRREPIDFTLS